MSYQTEHIAYPGETYDLLHPGRQLPGGETRPRPHRWWARVLAAAAVACGCSGCLVLLLGWARDDTVDDDRVASLEAAIWGKSKDKVKFQDLTKNKKWEAFEAEKRCDWVIEHFTKRYQGVPEENLRVQYAAQSTDANVFYRATAEIFWIDFADGYYGGTVSFADVVASQAKLKDVRLHDKSTWTWVTGDQHLSNFGAWRNRHGDVVFGVNDFDEAAIFDFHVDVVRIAVSIYNHATTNGLSKKETKAALRAFTDTYIDTVSGYVDNEKANLFELTKNTAKGKLEKFLKDVEEDESKSKQLEKFTEVDETGTRRFIKSDKTRLVPVSAEVEQQIREAFTSTKYGATLTKTGWKVHQWDDEFYKVLDVCARLGSGIGSYGVDRYYVLLQGTDDLLSEDADGAAVILDVKYEPSPAVSRVLDADDAAWYGNMFSNEAARAVQGQRKLTSYTDPYTGWVEIGGEFFYVRQRSPWKDSPNLDKLTKVKDFTEFVEQVAISTATSHTRGTVGNSPAQFKDVIAAIFADDKDNRKAWGEAVERVAHHYREQVLLDFQCFQEFVEANYS